MKVKKFIADTIQQAMQQVKQELGPDAVILQTRTSSKRLLGLFPRHKVEITAAADVVPTGSAVRAREKGPPVGSESLPSTPATAATGVSVTTSRLESLEDKIAKLTSTVEALVEKSFSGPEMPGEWKSIYQRLLFSGMEESLAREVVEALSHKHSNASEVLAQDEILTDCLARNISAEGCIQVPEEGQRIVVLVGPTGVGKTTTLAKIAAGYLKEGRRIAFVTADTYRLAAVDQLQKYADIMGLCLETVYSPDEMARAIARHSDKEMVFVDTAGRSQRDSGQMEEIQAFVTACQPAEVHLLLSATTKREDLEEILERFSVCSVNRLVLTKADESTCFGPVYSVVKRYPIPFSYITTGQNVPEDIEEASAEKIARLICRGTLSSSEEGSVTEGDEKVNAEVSAEVGTPDA